MYDRFKCCAVQLKLPSEFNFDDSLLQGLGRVYQDIEAHGSTIVTNSN